MKTNKIWSKDEVEFLKNNYSKYPKLELARLLNRSLASVSGFACLLKITKKRPEPIQIGQKFDKLTVINKCEEKSINGNVYYICQCDCGNIKTVQNHCLRHGNTTSCGCKNIDRFRKYGKSHIQGDGVVSFNTLFGQCKRSARQRDIIFDLTKEQHKNIVTQNCNYCGENPKKYNPYYNTDGSLVKGTIFSETAERAWIKANGIDRVDNKKGYTLENCVSCCADCNEMKMDHTENDFLNHIKKIFNFQKELNEKDIKK